MCISQKITDSPAGRRFLLLGKAPAGAPAERRAGGREGGPSQALRHFLERVL